MVWKCCISIIEEYHLTLRRVNPLILLHFESISSSPQAPNAFVSFSLRPKNERRLSSSSTRLTLLVENELRLPAIHTPIRPSTCSYRKWTDSRRTKESSSSAPPIRETIWTRPWFDPGGNVCQFSSFFVYLSSFLSFFSSLPLFCLSHFLSVSPPFFVTSFLCHFLSVSLPF